ITIDRIFCGNIVFCCLEAVGISFTEDATKVAHSNTILGTTRAGQTGLNSAKVKFEQVIELRLWSIVGTEEALSFGVAFNQINQFGLTPGIAQVAKCFGIDREEGSCRAKFG